MRQSGMNMEQVKKRNRAMILRYICAKEAASRVDIAAECGLTPAAVTQITNALLGDGILREVGVSEEQTGVGRRKVLLAINYEHEYIFSINIDQSRTCIAITDMGGKLAIMTSIDTDSTIEPETFLGKIADTCNDLWANLKPMMKRRIKGISVGIPGIVDVNKGMSIKAYGIWDQPVDVCGILSRHLDLPVIIQNNVTALARAELLFGAGRYMDDLLIVKWGPGVGSAIVIDGDIYEEKQRKTAELGHMIVEPGGSICSCGKSGCLETRVSYMALGSILGCSPERITEALELADEGQIGRVREAIALFATAIVNACALIAPDRVVLCGSLFDNEKLRSMLREEVVRLDPVVEPSYLVHSDLHSMEEYIGPAAEFFQRLLRDEKTS